MVLTSNWSAGSGFNIEGTGVDDRATRGGPALRSKGGGNIWYYLTLQVYAQPFVSAGAYSNFKEVVRPRASPFAAQFVPYAYAGEPDFNYRSFRMTNVLRWEYKPGSALYVVWQQVRENSAAVGAFRFRQDMSDLFGRPATNVFLVKFSYWLNM
ncbi:MAG TPA: DUF5916 domain-containing protein [Vicinamibacterales bacterium]